MDKIDKIFIADLGLQNEHLGFLNTICDKIEIFDAKVKIGNSKKVFSSEWIDSVSQKTVILRTLIESNRVPIIMLDSDTVIIEDFSKVIETKYDIQICKRSTPMLRKDNFVLEHIASFFIANSSNATIFLSDWINRLEERIKLNLMPPHETPAMIETLQNNTNNNLNIGFLDENVVSCENNYIKDVTKIIHAKSRNPRDHISIYRFANIKNLPYYKIIKLFNNGRERILFSLAFFLKRLFQVHDLKKMIKKTILRK